MFQGAQERSVPATNGCIPGAPDGGHSSQAGMLLDGAAVALPDDPPELACEDDLGPAPPDALDRALAGAPPDSEFVAAVLEVDPVAVVDGAAVVALGLAPVVAVKAVVLLPSVTTPPFVTRYGTAVVCAKACVAATTKNSAP
jgi:hypothetical protein